MENAPDVPRIGRKACGVADDKIEILGAAGQVCIPGLVVAPEGEHLVTGSVFKGVIVIKTGFLKALTPLPSLHRIVWLLRQPITP
jgi:hypothetical protein